MEINARVPKKVFTIKIFLNRLWKLKYVNIRKLKKK